MDMKEAKERLARATAPEPQCTCPSSPHFGHPAECLWSQWVHTSMPAKIEIENQALNAQAALIRAVEALEERPCSFEQGRALGVIDETHNCGSEYCDRCKALDAWKAL